MEMSGQWWEMVTSGKGELNENLCGSVHYHSVTFSFHSKRNKGHSEKHFIMGSIDVP
jgi:hypothetical protein